MSPPKSVPELISKKITLYLPEIEKVKVMELPFCDLTTDIFALLKRDNGDQLFPFPQGRQSIVREPLQLHNALGAAQKNFLIFNLQSFNSSVSQALIFKMGIITPISCSCRKAQCINAHQGFRWPLTQ